MHSVKEEQRDGGAKQRIFIGELQHELLKIASNEEKHLNLNTYFLTALYEINVDRFQPSLRPASTEGLNCGAAVS